MSTNRPRRLLRNSKACDFCHKRRIRCQSSPLGPARCQNCVDFDIPCTYDRPSRRGTKPPQPSGSYRQQGFVAEELPYRNTQVQVIPPYGSEPNARIAPAEACDASSSAADDKWNEPLGPAWQSFARTSTPVVKKLLSVYHEAVYPIFPFFDRLRLERRLLLLEHTRNRAFFCSVMAACALASARVRDGALDPSRANDQGLSGMPPEVFYAAADEALPKDLLRCQDFDYLRGCALLAIASIQDAKIGAMQKYIGHYFTILAITQWHDEGNWPSDLSSVEMEERRILYWSTYTLDIYSAIVWDGCIHFQEGHAKVEYPSSGGDGHGSRGPIDGNHWMVGWNFTTDLYRLLEHDVTRLRSRSSKLNIFGDRRANAGLDMPSHNHLQEVNDLFAALPRAFKELRPVTGDPDRDIYGFQTANIQATMALLRMVYLSLEEDVDLQKKCSVASDVLSTFHQVPKPYLRAISTPLIYHIAGIGTVLGSVMESPLSETTCLRVRDLLLSMAALLEGLESSLHSSAGAARRLRDLVARIEDYLGSRNGGHPDHTAVRSEAPDTSLVGDASVGAWGDESISNLSPQFQLPDELLQDWTWPFNMSHNYLSF